MKLAAQLAVLSACDTGMARRAAAKDYSV